MGRRGRQNVNPWRTWGHLYWAMVLGAWLVSNAGAAASPSMQLAKSVEDGAEGLALTEAYVRQSPTFQYDGLEESLHMEAVRPLTGCPGCYEYTWYFESLFPGYGDRTGLALTPSRTPHRAQIVLAGEMVVSGVLDHAWDMTRQLILDVE